MATLPAPKTKPAPPKRTVPTRPTKTVERIDIATEMERLKAMYQESTKNGQNILLLGESGSGKTFLMNTAPGLSHIDSFDPGGSTGLRSKVESGDVIVDRNWEDEDPLKPCKFKEWCTKTEERMAGGYFEQINNYMLDSATTWSSAIMNKVLKDAGIPGQAPRFTHDYGPQKQLINNWLKRLLTLPCNVIITGHLKVDRDEVSGSVIKRFMTTGQGAVIIPLLFDEIWVMSPKKSSGGVAYRVLTASTGTDLARSRLSAGGLLDQYEEANLTNIFRKAGVLK